MGSSKNKILEEILPLRIIREVEKWPVLYMRDCPEMPNMHFKNKIWHEVARALIKDWDSYSPAEKECKILDLTKKWRNLRDTFKRQVTIEQKRREGHNIKKKKYVYFKHMSFLLPHMQSPPSPERAAAAPPALRRKRSHAECAAAAALSGVGSELDNIDEDKHFLMSLLPSLKRMTDDEKLTAKMEILKVIKEVRQRAAPGEPYVCELAHYDDRLSGSVKSEPLADELAHYRSASESSALSDCADSN